MFAFILLITLFFSCSKKTVNIIQANPNQGTYTESLDSIAPKERSTFQESVNTIEKRPPTILVPKDYMIASLKKTECYGHCAVFEFKVFWDGKATLKGEKYIDKIGEFIAEVDTATLKRIKEQGEVLKIIHMQNTYPTNNFFIQDLPMTFISFHNGYRAKLIRNNYDAPKALLEYEQFLEKVIQQLNWKRADQP